MPQGSAMKTMKLCQQVDGMQVYHICFSNPHCRHGKRQALEGPVLGNLSKGREAGYKRLTHIMGSCSASVGLDFTLIVTNLTVIPSWGIVISVSLLTLCLPWLWARLRRNWKGVGTTLQVKYGLEYTVLFYYMLQKQTSTHCSREKTTSIHMVTSNCPLPILSISVDCKHPSRERNIN